MIRVEKITIREFRGIRDLAIDFRTKNFAICGPNGTGKSGVVDALEFGLTGGISRLSGKGTKEISIAEHAPHVDSMKRPDKAKVTLSLYIPSLKKSVQIERTVSQRQTPAISDKDPKVLAILRQVADHPEFSLSRRELIQYILSTPGDRAKEVQALLRLDAIESMRAVLLKISNASKRAVEPLKKEQQIAKDNLLRALDITQLQKEKTLAVVNAKREVLGLPPLAEITPTTSFKDGLAAVKPGDAPTVPKIQALSDIERLKEVLDEVNNEESKAKCEQIVQDLEALKDNPHIAENALKENLLRSALAMVEDKACPVCDTQWEPEHLKEHINGKLAELKDTSAKRNAIEVLLKPHIDCLIESRDALAAVARYGAKFKPPIDATAANDFMNEINRRIKVIGAFVPVADTIVVVKEITVVPVNVQTLIEKIEAAISAIPDPTKQDAAREYLTVAQERLDTFRGVSRRLKKAEEQATLAKTAFDCYIKVSTGVLDGIYKSVAKEFGELYSYINSDDEKEFTAKLTPSYGRLGFDVDFYGRGFFPPGAYHSEGHQDGMGLCLYLALMKHLMSDGFMFAVLDDVLMSVDTGHRREVCKLLKEKFPDTQFILTTHDPIWLKHMNTVGLIAPTDHLHFRQWDVDHGPTDWDSRDVWQEIEDMLRRNDVPNAAGTLRRYLEFFSKEACHSLRAPVVFRGDAQYQLGELMPAAIGQFRKHLRAGKAAAQSWGNDADEAKVSAYEESFAKLATASNVDQWQINAAIHYNEWANLKAGDFRPVVQAFRDLLATFVCAKDGCGAIYVTPDAANLEAIRCGCGSINFNLKKK